MATPLFVLGKHRSGTTWLANQLCQHSLIAGVQHPHHHGVHESIFFSHIEGRYGDLSKRSNFTELTEVLAASDFFRLAGADRAFLHSLWPTSYADVFRQVMDRYAASRRAEFWLDKSPPHTLLATRIARHYPDATFIAVVRDVVGVVASSIARPRESWGGARSRRAFMLRTTGSWMRYRAALSRFERSSSPLLVLQYEDLRRDLETSMRAVCRFLQVDFEPRMCDRAFPPNTSFRRPRDREAALSDNEARVVRLLAKVWPSLSLWKSGEPGVKAIALPNWFFQLAWKDLDMDRSPLDSSTASPSAARDGSAP